MSGDKCNIEGIKGLKARSFRSEVFIFISSLGGDGELEGCPPSSVTADTSRNYYTGFKSSAGLRGDPSTQTEGDRTVHTLNHTEPYPAAPRCLSTLK